MSDTDQIAYNHVDGCVKAYLHGKKSLNWVMSFIRGHHLPSHTLVEIIAKHKDGSTGSRFDELLASCQRELVNKVAGAHGVLHDRSGRGWVFVGQGLSKATIGTLENEAEDQ